MGARTSKWRGSALTDNRFTLRHHLSSKSLWTSRHAAPSQLILATRFKRPKLRLDAFQFSRAPDTGKNAGSIYVKQGEEYLGKVTAGRFLPVRECGDERAARIVAVASDPAAAAKAYGLRTGECSCCGRTLTNGLSIDLGIGPICRERFGW